MKNFRKISSLISYFPYLKSLTIAKSKGLQSLLIPAKSSKLVTLSILLPHLKDLRFTSLQFFQFRGPTPRLRVNDDACTVNDFRKGPPYGRVNYDFSSILCLLRYVKL